MGCAWMKPRPMTLFEAKDLAGARHGWGPDHRARKRGEPLDVFLERTHVEQIAHEKATILPGVGGIFCGDAFTTKSVCSRCGLYADILCDFPMGKGTTCDLPLCDDCTHRVGDDLDLCPLHHPIWVASAGVSAMAPWPPTRKPR